MEISSFLKVEEFGARLDWLTLTAPRDREEAGEFHRFARDYMNRERERYGSPSEARIRGYAGIQIADTKHVRRAYDGHEMLIVSGEHANRLAEEVIVHETPTKVRRIDARVLARARGAVFNYPELLRAEIIRSRQESGKKKRKKLVLYDSTFGNDGISIGSRTSERYVRIYDHDAKHGSGAAGIYWAHEGEYKAASAEKFWEGYKGATNRNTYTAGVVRNTLESMAIPCSWLGNVDEVGLVVGRKQTTNERRLKYQASVGIPMLQQLVAEGCAEEVKALLKAHGLDSLFK